jgi:hypothetical protein
MNDIQKMRLPNGTELILDKEELESTFDEVIEKFVMPFYQETNDWSKTLHLSIIEIEKISTLLNLSKGKIIGKFLKQIEVRLDRDFSYLPGTDKIEILFEALDDYVQTLATLIKDEGSKEDIRLKIASVVENLNLFEISELILYYAKKK